MQHFDRQPPRYVPTLTDVVPEGLPITRPAAPPHPEAVEGVRAGDAVSGAATEPVAQAPVLQPAPEAASVDLAALQEAMVERLMVRMQPLLEERLRYAVADIVRTQTEALAHRLRDAVEDVVRNAVADAVAEERNHQP